MNGEMLWTGVFGDVLRNYCWERNWRNANALDLPGHRLQSYVAWSKAHIHSRYVVNVYVGKDDIVQEMLYMVPKVNNCFRPILPRVFHNLFPDLQFLEMETPPYDWWKYVELVETNGRILFKFKVEDWNRFEKGVRMNDMPHSFVGSMLRKFGPAISLASAYPDSIKNLDSAAEVMRTICRLSLLSLRRNGYYESEMETLRTRLKNTSQAIDEQNALFDKICNNAADALNTLSGKFGIVVNI